jgi:hypothetical protein
VNWNPKSRAFIKAHSPKKWFGRGKEDR